jgi:hypothetical protein
MTKRWILFSCAVFTTLSTGCHQEGGRPTPPAGDKLEVHVRLKADGTDCDVDYEAVNLRSSDADQISWCVKDNAKTNYYIHFLNGSPVGNSASTAGNDFLVNKNAVGHSLCSDMLTPVTGQLPAPYPYEIHYNSPSGAKCSDPTVILK